MEGALLTSSENRSVDRTVPRETSEEIEIFGLAPFNLTYCILSINYELNYKSTIQ